MKVHYFVKELDFETAMETCAFEVDTYNKPELIVDGIRNTMEDLAYRTGRRAGGAARAFCSGCLAPQHRVRPVPLAGLPSCGYLALHQLAQTLRRDAALENHFSAMEYILGTPTPFR